MARDTSRLISLWLFACAALVFAMVVVGGITRLTDSGLSITEWKPLLGAVPPLNEAQWHEVFEKYQASPEFEKKHFWMALDDFKKIFFWEWFHRLLGRMIGVVYALPLLWLWARRQIPAGYGWKLLLPFVLGGAQGFMGWYMVKSGLVDVPAVSHFRLAAHLSLAFVIIALLVWLGLAVRGVRRYPDRALFAHGLSVFCMLVVTVLWGAFTAGLDAGLIYNDTFPKMGDAWIPPAFFKNDPLWFVILERHEAVQFMHRWLAMATAFLTLGFWAHGMMRGAVFPALHALGGMVILQFGLGLATLFSHVTLPLAVAHQAGASILICLFVVCLMQLHPGRS